MPKKTPFHDCVACFNEPQIWKHWSGYLVEPNYQYSIAAEYYAIRNSVAVLDTSPLFKYEISGTDAEAFLQVALARDIRRCQPGQSQYTVWCNENGFVLQDGVIIRLADDRFLLTAAEPTLRYFRKLATERDFTKVQINDVSQAYGILAVQGPLSFDVLAPLAPHVSKLGFFDACESSIAEKPVVISRTGFTGDLGYEIWCRTDDAGTVWDAIMKTDADYGITPIGTTALKMARVEAGLLLMGVDFESAKFAWVDDQRATPIELGWGWMLRKLKTDDRPFVGRAAIENKIADKSGRFATVGLEINWKHYQQVHTEAGISTPLHELYFEQTFSLYKVSDTPYDYAGFASSLLFSSLLKKIIAIGRVPIECVKVGTELEIELSVIRKPVYVRAVVSKLPFFNPVRKTAMPEAT